MSWTKPGPGRGNSPTGAKRGRPAGARSASSLEKNREAAEFCKRIIYDPRYQANLLERARAGALPPQMEALLFYFVFGKPTEKVEISAPELTKPLENLSEAELATRTAALMDRIRDMAQATKDAPETVEASVVRVGVVPPAIAETSESGLGVGVAPVEAEILPVQVDAE